MSASQPQLAPRPAARRRISFGPFDGYRLALLSLTVLYVVVFAKLAFDLHAGMRTHKADLGQIDQAVWNSSRGRFVETTDNGFIAARLTDHVEPILALISPVFWLWDDVRALLLLQVLFAAAGAWLLYELALRQLDAALSPEQRTQIWQIEPLRQLTRPLALTLAVAYLLTPQIQSALLTEFHAAPLATPLILWAFWSVAARRWIQFVMASIAVAVVKEEMALLAAALGLWAMWRIYAESRAAWVHGEPVPPSRAAYLVAAAVTIGGMAWFAVATFVIVPAHAVDVYGVAESGYFQRYGALGDSPTDIARSLLTRPLLVWQIASEPARLEYLIGLMAPFGFFSLLAPEILLLSLPLLLANLLSAYPAQYYGEFHYSAPVMAYVAASAAYGSARLWRWLYRRTDTASPDFQQMPAADMTTMTAMSAAANARSAIRPLLALCIGGWIVISSATAYWQAGRAPFAARYDPTPITTHHRLLDRFTAQLPADAAVTATAAVHPHVSHRRFVYQFPIGLETPVRADWALLDVTTNTDMAPGDLKGRVDQMLTGDWGVADAADGFLLLHRGEPNKSIPDQFYDFARTPAPTTPVAGEEGDAPLRFAGIEVDDWPRWRQTRLSTLWQVGAAFDPTSDRPQLEVRTPNGETVYSFSDAAPPALLWYPPDRWRPGDVLRLTTLPLYLPGAWGVALSHAAENLKLPKDDNDGLTLVAARQRLAGDRLAVISPELDAGGNLGAQMAALTGSSRRLSDAHFDVGAGAQLDVSAWMRDGPTPAGGPLDVWLEWRADPAWPSNLTPFVHLRKQAENVDQIDGMPRFFVRYAVEQALAQAGVAGDWRQLTLPEGANDEDALRVVIGLYNAQSGARATVVDATGATTESEVEVGRPIVAPPALPDQACALIPATCASQPPAK